MLELFAYRLLVIVDARLVTTYGITSSRRGTSRFSKSWSVPSCESMSGFDWLNWGQLMRSLYR